MTVKAFILIDTSPGKAKEVAHKLRGVQGVIYAHTVTGPHDIIALVESRRVFAGRTGRPQNPERRGSKPQPYFDRGRLTRGAARPPSNGRDADHGRRISKRVLYIGGAACGEES